MAGLGLQRLIIMNTKANIDQDHFTVVHISDSEHIGNRQTYLAEVQKSSVNLPNPGKEMSKVAISISKAAINLGKPCLAGVVCNTFHAPPIYKEYSNIIDRYNEQFKTNKSPGYIKLINLIEVTSQYIAKKGYKKVGIISADGTRSFKVYTHYIDKIDDSIDVKYLDDDRQKLLEEDIFNIKTKSYASKKVVKNIEQQIDYLKSKGIDCIVLGCSELPIAITTQEVLDIPVVNPIEIMAKNMIKLSNSNKLKG